MRIQLSKLSKNLQAKIRKELSYNSDNLFEDFAPIINPESQEGKGQWRRRGFRTGPINGEINQTEIVIRKNGQEIIMDWNDFEYILAQYQIMKKDKPKA